VHEVSPQGQTASLRLRFVHVLFCPMGSVRVAAGLSAPDMQDVALSFEAWKLVHSQQMACLSQPVSVHGHCCTLIV
jgi:hypothetical protein